MKNPLKRAWDQFKRQGKLGKAIIVLVAACVPVCCCGGLISLVGGPATPISALTPTLMWTPTPTPTSVLLSLPVSIESRGFVFELTDIQLRQTLEASGKRYEAKNGAYLILLGVFKNNAGELECVKADSFWIYTASSRSYKLDYSLARQVKDLYGCDYPGQFLGQCLSPNEMESTYMIFDVDTDARGMYLRFKDARLDLGDCNRLRERLAQGRMPMMTPTAIPTTAVTEVSIETLIPTLPRMRTTTPTAKVEEVFSLTPTVVQQTPLSAGTLVPAPMLTSTSTPTPTSYPKAVVNTTVLNLRSGPGTSYDRVGQVRRGEELAMLGRNADGEWLKVRTSLGAEAWIAADFVDIRQGTVDGLLVLKAPPTPTISPTPRPTPKPTAIPGLETWVYHDSAAVGISDIGRRTAIGWWEADSGHEFVSIGVNYANRGRSGTVHCNPLYFQLQTEDGVIYDPEWLAQLEPTLKAVDLAPGGRTKGWVTFQVPVGSRNLKLLWKPCLVFCPTTYIPLQARTTPTNPQPVKPDVEGAAVLIADSLADFSGYQGRNSWWFLYSVGRNNFEWREMRGGGNNPECYRTDQPDNVICSDFARPGFSGDVALQYKSEVGGTIKIEIELSLRNQPNNQGVNVYLYRHLQQLRAYRLTTLDARLTDSVVQDVAEGEFFFLVFRANNGDERDEVGFRMRVSSLQ